MNASEIARRTLHLKLYPSPKTFSHRREVLRMISKYGEVSMFSSFKVRYLWILILLKWTSSNHLQILLIQYHIIGAIGNAFTVIFSTSASAQALLDASPINYRVIPTPSSPTTPETDTSPATLNFSLHVSPTNFSHEEFLTSRFSNPLHGPFFPKPPRLSQIGAALESYVSPGNHIELGLLDWDTDRGRGVLRVRNFRMLRTPGIMREQVHS